MNWTSKKTWKRRPAVKPLHKASDGVSQDIASILHLNNLLSSQQTASRETRVTKLNFPRPSQKRSSQGARGSSCHYANLSPPENKFLSDFVFKDGSDCDSRLKKARKRKTRQVTPEASPSPVVGVAASAGYQADSSLTSAGLQTIDINTKPPAPACNKKSKSETPVVSDGVFVGGLFKEQYLPLPQNMDLLSSGFLLSAQDTEKSRWEEKCDKNTRFPLKTSDFETPRDQRIQGSPFPKLNSPLKHQSSWKPKTEVRLPVKRRQALNWKVDLDSSLSNDEVPVICTDDSRKTHTSNVPETFHVFYSPMAITPIERREPRNEFPEFSSHVRKLLPELVDSQSTVLPTKEASISLRNERKKTFLSQLAASSTPNQHTPVQQESHLSQSLLTLSPISSETPKSDNVFMQFQFGCDIVQPESLSGTGEMHCHNKKIQTLSSGEYYSTAELVAKLVIEELLFLCCREKY